MTKIKYSYNTNIIIFCCLKTGLGLTGSKHTLLFRSYQIEKLQHWRRDRNLRSFLLRYLILIWFLSNNLVIKKRYTPQCIRWFRTALCISSACRFSSRKHERKTKSISIFCIAYWANAKSTFVILVTSSSDSLFFFLILFVVLLLGFSVLFCWLVDWVFQGKKNNSFLLALQSQASAPPHPLAKIFNWATCYVLTGIRLQNRNLILSDTNLRLSGIKLIICE